MPKKRTAYGPASGETVECYGQRLQAMKLPELRREAIGVGTDRHLAQPARVMRAAPLRHHLWGRALLAAYGLPPEWVHHHPDALAEVVAVTGRRSPWQQ